MRSFLIFLLVLCLMPAGAAAQASSQSVRVTNANGQSVVAVTNTTPGSSDYGLVVRCASGCSGGGTSSTFGAAFPSTGTAAGARDAASGNMVGVSAVNLGTLSGSTVYAMPTLLAIPGSGGTPVQPVVETGAVSGGAVLLSGGTTTTSAPTYTDGRVNPLSLTTAGALRVDASATTQPVSGTVAATQSGTWSVRAQDGSGNALGSATAAPGSSDRGLVVRVAPAASIVAGQQSVTASAVALPATAVQQVCVKHIVGGSQSTVYVGPSGVTTSTGYPLEQGDSACYATDSAADLFVIAAGTGSSVAYTGVP